MKLSRDFKEFIASLNAHDVRYLVVGGYAVALHGYPRFTKDLDVWLWLEAENATKAVQALADFGFASLDITSDDFLVPDKIIQLGYPPNRIDLITTLPGVEFASCFEQREVVMVDDIPVNFIDRESLKRNKRASGRLQDLADLENLA
jgi:hypothetical protein